MNLKMKTLAAAIIAAGTVTAAQAADVAMFPYVVTSSTVTTIVSAIDTGTGATQRYNSAGVVGAGAGFNRNHWRLNFKADANAAVNTAPCQEVNYFLPTSSNDIQTVDIGGAFGSATKGVLFNDPSINNNWNGATTATINFMLGKAAGAVQRGVLYVHNADNVAGQTVLGEAMILDFSTGAAWGYQAVLGDNGNANDNSVFNYTNAATNAPTATVAAPVGVLSFMPFAESTTRLFVTPVYNGAPMLDTNGASINGWERANARVGLVTGTGVAFDRDENLVSGTSNKDVNCVGAVDAKDMMTSGAQNVLANGGWGRVAVDFGTIDPIFGVVAIPTNTAYLTKLEYNTTGKFNGQAIAGTFNNGFIMR